MKRIYIPKKESSKWISYPTIVTASISFFLGCVATTTIIMNYKFHFESTPTTRTLPSTQQQQQQLGILALEPSDMWIQQQHRTTVASFTSGSSMECSYKNNNTINDATTSQQQQQQQQRINHPNDSFDIGSILRNVHILVVIASYDFSQLPHLEEVLSSYHDICISSGTIIDIHIHTTIPYPVSLIDLFNSRINCPTLSISIIIKPKSLRLHLVDCHRETFYNNIHKYDLFIYTEDDIRVTPTTVATYLYETILIEQMLSELNNQTDSSSSSSTAEGETTTKYVPSDFNVGIVRFEYNYPANVIIDDNTRHATQNVSRVYWEHSGPYERPAGIVPNAIRALPQTRTVSDLFHGRYITMKNHHQGMYLATRELLLAWKDRASPNKCEFSTVRDRPGKKHQPTQGTQRVWMSSQMLYGKQHCNVQQVLPVHTFGTLTVYHLPNKNYRRVGKYRNRTFSDGTEVFVQPHSTLLTAMQLHIGSKQAFPSSSTGVYNGKITMIDEVDYPEDRTFLLERRMEEYKQYVERGGILSEEDMTKLDLVEDQ